MRVWQKSSLPSSVESAAQLTCGVLNNPNSRPTIILIDALNQVRDSSVLTCCIASESVAIGADEPYDTLLAMELCNTVWYCNSESQNHKVRKMDDI